MEQFIQTLGTVNFRTKPTTDSAVIKNLPANTVVEVLNTVDNTTWYHARLEDGTEGYITSLTKYVKGFVPDWLKTAKEMIAYGETYLGTPYVFGSDRNDDDDFDCSDFTKWCAKKYGYTLHADSRSQDKYDGVKVPLNKLRTGDLIIFDTDKDGVINHVGFYKHPNQVLHTYKKGIGVTISSFAPDTYWPLRAVDAKRFIQ